MARIKLDPEVFGLSRVFEQATRARVMDCFVDDEAIVVIVAAGEMGKALGKGGENIRRAQQKFGKKVKVVEYNDDAQLFVKNFIYPLKVEEITTEDGCVVLRDAQKKTKSLLIGRGGKRLNVLKRAVSRFFPLDVRVE